MHHVKITWILQKITKFLLYFSRSKLPHPSSPELLMNPLRWKDFDSHKHLKSKLIRYIWKEVRYTFENYGSLCFLRTRAIVSNKHSFTYLVKNYMWTPGLVDTWEYYSEHCWCGPGVLSGNHCSCIITFNPKDFDVNVLRITNEEAKA